MIDDNIALDRVSWLVRRYTPFWSACFVNLIVPIFWPLTVVCSSVIRSAFNIELSVM